MNSELEVKFLNIDIDLMREKLKGIGAECLVPMRHMQRYVFKHPTKENAFLRLRNEGTKITTTYKEHDDRSAIDSVKEIEVEISDLESMRQIYINCGLQEKAIQESYRESRVYKNVDIGIDRWPGLNPFIEIEGPTTQKIYEVVDLLGLKIEDGIMGTVSDIYFKELGIPHKEINRRAIITFENPPEQYSS